MRGRPLPSSLRSRVVVVVLTLGSAALGTTFACGTSPVGVESCQKIERVRCESAQACGLKLDRPAHQGETPEQAVAACIRYYDDQCLHGLATTIEPSSQAVDACVNAIITGDCEIVKAPETNAACKFLIPPASAAGDASVEAEASTDAATAAD